MCKFVRGAYFRYGRKNHVQITGFRSVHLRGGKERIRGRGRAERRADTVRRVRLGHRVRENVRNRSGSRAGQQRRYSRHRAVFRSHPVRLGQVMCSNILFTIFALSLCLNIVRITRGASTLLCFLRLPRFRC